MINEGLMRRQEMSFIGEGLSRIVDRGIFGINFPNFLLVFEGRKKNVFGFH